MLNKRKGNSGRLEVAVSTESPENEISDGVDQIQKEDEFILWSTPATGDRQPTRGFSKNKKNKKLSKKIDFLAQTVKNCFFSKKTNFVEWENSYSKSSFKFQQSYGFSMDIAGQRPRSLLNVMNQKGMKVNQVIQYTTWGGAVLILIACAFQWCLVSDIIPEQQLSSN